LTKTEKAILGYLIEAPDLTSDELADKINVTRRTIERATSNLQKKGLIERIGSKRAGKWLVIK
ncbi:MAG: winged helix-turn-helix transcriptional regulator, partial [Oscillospiraceae bacterium]|nr:winged helix-turn-helix transcriptional regulator [Oscillospiraceae bacterium]